MPYAFLAYQEISKKANASVKWKSEFLDHQVSKRKNDNEVLNSYNACSCFLLLLQLSDNS